MHALLGVAVQKEQVYPILYTRRVSVKSSRWLFRTWFIDWNVAFSALKERVSFEAHNNWIALEATGVLELAFNDMRRPLETSQRFSFGSLYQVQCTGIDASSSMCITDAPLWTRITCDARVKFDGSCRYGRCNYCHISHGGRYKKKMWCKTEWRTNIFSWGLQLRL